MADVIGKGVIEVSADASKLKAGIDDAKRSIKSFGKDVSDSVGTASARASKSIDNYVRNLQTVAATNGKSTREVELYKLALKGASEAQLGAASNALKMNEAYEKGVVIGERLKTGFLTLAAAASAAAVASVTHSIALLDSLDDLSEKTGITVEKLSELRFAGEAVGTKFEDLQVGIRKLSKLMAEAAGGNKEAVAVFDALGVSATDSAGKLRDTGTVLEDIASKFSGYTDGAGKAALAQEVFGKSGAEMIPLLNQGASGIRALGSEAKQLGAIYSGDLAKSAADFNDNLTKIKLGSEAAAVSLAGPLIGALAKLSAQYLQAKKDGDAFLPTLGAIAQYATLPGQFTLLGQIASGKLFKGRDGDNDSETARLLARSKSLKDTIAKVDAPVVKKPETEKKVGGGGGKDNSAAQEAKAQLTSDLDEIRKAGEALSNTISNNEKVMEAKRSASLISESEYYQKKREFIQQNEAIQEETSQKEIARLQQEVLTGKDKIDNDRKIADAQAKLSKIRQNSATDLEILAIKEKDSLDSIARAYVDARAAAQSYLDVTERARQLQIDGMGKGNKARDFAAGISQITERYEQQRQDLQRDNRNGKFAGREADYQRELDLLNEFQDKSIASYKRGYDEIQEKQKSFYLGASEALQNYYDESQNVFEQTQEVVTNAFKGMEDALVDFVTTGKMDFKSLADSIIKDIARMVVKQSITGPLANMVGGLIGGGSGGADSAGFESLIAKFAGGRAIGGPVSANRMYEVNEKGTPELLSVAGRQYLMTGNQSGEVKTMSSKDAARSGDTYISIPVNGRVDRETKNQIANAVSLEQRRARRLE